MAAIRMKSYAREKNAENVEANGFQRSPTCIPTAAASSCCSAMNISK